MKTIISLVLMALLPSLIFAQEEERKLTKKESKQVMEAVSKQLSNIQPVVDSACECIGRIDYIGKSDNQIHDSIANCIDKEVSSYELMQKLNAVLLDSKNKKNKNITVNVGAKTAEYKNYYYEVERKLMDSCDFLREIIALNNKQSEKSVSKNVLALDLYEKGSQEFSNNNIKAALDFFERAVAIDDKFAFCWDNIGVCYRKLGNYDEAINAYKKSIEIDPDGETPLRNIAVVYDYKKDYKNCITAYESYINKFPKDAEGYFGLGRVYLITNNYDEGLQNLCKAYNIYLETNSPYRTDAETMISMAYKHYKEKNELKKFNKILEDHKIKAAK